MPHLILILILKLWLSHRPLHKLVIWMKQETAPFSLLLLSQECHSLIIKREWKGKVISWKLLPFGEFSTLQHRLVFNMRYYPEQRYTYECKRVWTQYFPLCSFHVLVPTANPPQTLFHKTLVPNGPSSLWIKSKMIKQWFLISKTNSSIFLTNYS